MNDLASAQNAELGHDTTPDTEARARIQGWRPKEEFRGPPEKWIDAEKFLDVAAEVLPVARQQNKILEEKVSRLENQNREISGKLTDVTQVLTDFREFASRGEQRAYERAKKELMDRRDAAIQHADRDAFNKVDAEIIELDKSVRPKPAVEERGAAAGTGKPPPPDPAIVAWIAENPWFNTDADLNLFARSHDDYLLKAKPGLPVSDRLAAVKAKTKAEFPDKFENPLRESAASVATPRGGGQQRAPKHSYENLPPEAKKACDKFVKTIPGFSKDEYVKAYAWED